MSVLPLPANLSHDQAKAVADKAVDSKYCTQAEADEALRLHAEANGKPLAAKPESKPAAPSLTKDQILAKLAKNEIEVEAASKLLSELGHDKPKGNIYCKVSEKKAVSVYGLQRMPVTLYSEQWERLLADEQVKSIRQFIADHKGELSVKADKKAAA
ncbi:MAG: hypothetical protein ACLP9L_15885 [Thermoguttaceae bacterium]